MRIIQNFEKHYKHYVAFLGIVLFALCSYDLFSPPIASKTIFRQTHTAMLTENFVKEGFSINGLYPNINGYEKYLIVSEFPVYNFVVGVFYKIFGNNPLWGKAISFICALFCLLIFIGLIKRKYGKYISILSGMFFILSPIGIMMYTSFQPDIFGLMFLMLSLWYLNKWRDGNSGKEFLAFSITLLIAGLSKYPLLVPYLPIIAIAMLFKEKKLKIPNFRTLFVFFIAFVLPFVTWYIYSRRYLTDFGRSSGIIDNMFFIGDLSRFLSITYYSKIAYIIPIFAMSGIGVIFFMLGLKKMDFIQKFIFAGIPFYFILIPTVRDQWYYLLPCVPIFAVFMAKGFSRIMEWMTSRNRKIAVSISAVIFIAGCILCTSYELRKDNVSLQAAIALRKVSKPNELALFMNMHDRAAGMGGINPTLSFLSQRKGWNIQSKGYDTYSLDNILRQIELNRKRGVKWLVYTYYSEELEPIWVRALVPKKYQPDPRKLFVSLDSDELIYRIKHLKNAVIGIEGANFVVIKLIDLPSSHDTTAK